MSGYYNGSHYPDPTAYNAIRRIEHNDNRVKDLIQELKEIIDDSGFELVERIVLRDKQSGRIYR